MSKHTPGPWTYSTWADHMPLAGMPSSFGADAEGDPIDIGEFSSEHGDLPLDVQLANARLIAEAPAMLEALRQVVNLAEDAVRNNRLLQAGEREFCEEKLAPARAILDRLEADRG